MDVGRRELFAEKAFQRYSTTSVWSGAFRLLCRSSSTGYNRSCALKRCAIVGVLERLCLESPNPKLLLRPSCKKISTTAAVSSFLYPNTRAPTRAPVTSNPIPLKASFTSTLLNTTWTEGPTRCQVHDPGWDVQQYMACPYRGALSTSLRWFMFGHSREIEKDK